MKTLLFGFEPFGPYQYNPTQDLVYRYNNKNIMHSQIIGQVLPCSYERASEIAIELILTHKPTAILATGLASRVPVIRIETRGHNQMDSKYLDADGRQYLGTPISPVDKDYYYTTADNEYMARTLQRCDINAELSNDAEGFICNALIYKVSRWLCYNSRSIRFTFIHIPWTDEYIDKIVLEPGKITIPENQLNRATEVIIQTLYE